MLRAVRKKGILSFGAFKQYLIFDFSINIAWCVKILNISLTDEFKRDILRFVEKKVLFLKMFKPFILYIERFFKRLMRARNIT